jgi:hypothetical protein
MRDPEFVGSRPGSTQPLIQSDASFAHASMGLNTSIWPHFDWANVIGFRSKLQKQRISINTTVKLPPLEVILR